MADNKNMNYNKNYRYINHHNYGYDNNVKDNSNIKNNVLVLIIIKINYKNKSIKIIEFSFYLKKS